MRKHLALIRLRNEPVFSIEQLSIFLSITHIFHYCSSLRGVEWIHFDFIFSYSISFYIEMSSHVDSMYQWYNELLEDGYKMPLELRVGSSQDFPRNLTRSYNMVFFSFFPDYDYICVLDISSRVYLFHIHFDPLSICLSVICYFSTLSVFFQAPKISVI